MASLNLLFSDREPICNSLSQKKNQIHCINTIKSSELSSSSPAITIWSLYLRDTKTRILSYSKSVIFNAALFERPKICKQFKYLSVDD